MERAEVPYLLSILSTVTVRKDAKLSISIKAKFTISAGNSSESSRIMLAMFIYNPKDMISLSGCLLTLYAERC